MKHIYKKYIGLGITVLVLFLVMYYWSRIESLGAMLAYAAAPLIIGFIVAYIVNIPMSFFENKLFSRVKNKYILKVKRPFCMILSFASLAAAVFLVVTLILPELVLCIKLLIEELPPMFEKLYKSLDEKYDIALFLEESFRNRFGADTDWKNVVEKMLDVALKGFGGVMGSVFTVVSAVFATAFNVIISFVFAVYLLAGKEKLCTGTKKVSSTYLSKSLYGKLSNVTTVANDSFHRFISGQCTEAVILGVLCIIGMLIFRFPYANMIGTLVGFTALIPVAGAYIGASVGAFMIFTADGIVSALLFVVFIIVLQQLEGNVIYPKVVGASIGLPGIWVLAAITVGGAIGGIFGMLISVPIAATAYKLLKNDIKKRTSPCTEEINSEDI